MAYVVRTKLYGSVSTFVAETDAAALRAMHEWRAEHASVVVTDASTGEEVDEFQLEDRIDARVADAGPNLAPAH